jgi:PAS domain S-box-containing protein
MDAPPPGPQPERDVPADDGRRNRVLLELSDATRELDDPVAIVARAMRTLREALSADRCAWAEVEDDEDHFTLLGCDCATGVPAIEGRWPLSAFGADARAAMRAGRPFVAHDTRAAPPAGSDPAAYEATGIGAVICAPLHRRGRLVAGAAVHMRDARAWSAADVALVDEIAQRCREAVERARSAIALADRSRELERERQRLALALMVGRSGTFEYDVQADRNAWDDELLALFGMMPGEAVGDADAFLAMVHADDRERVAAGMRRALKTGSWDDEFRIVRRDDARVRWMHGRAQVFYDGSGRALRVVGIHVDVSERKSAEEALRASEAQFRSLSDGVPVIVWVSDAAGRNEFVNLQYCNWFGVTRDGALGHDWHGLVHAQDLPDYAARQRAALEHGEPLRARVRVRRTDGAWRWLECWAVPRRADDGSFIGHIGMGLDMTETVDAQRALGDADRREDELLSLLAYGLRNPLVPALDAAKLLARDEPLTDTAQRAVGTIERQMLRMKRLIDDLLEVGRTMRGTPELRRQPVLLSTTVAAVVESLRPAFDARKQRLLVDPPPRPLHVVVDPSRLGLVLENLLANANRCTPEGGTVRIETVPDDDAVRIAVADDGIGLGSADLERVFEPFVQAHGPGCSTPGGLGIGLAIVRRLVELHGGTVHAESEGPGRGARFVVSLPTGRDPAATPADRADPRPSA